MSDATDTKDLAEVSAKMPSIELWLDSQGQCTWMNRNTERLLGYRAAELAAMDDFVETVILEEHRQKVREAIQSALAGNDGEGLVYGYLCRSGERRWSRVSWQAVFNQDHAVKGVRVSGVDITELRCVQKECREHVQQRNALLEGLPHLAMIVSKDRKVLYANKASRDAGVSVGGACSQIFGEKDLFPEASRTFGFCRLCKAEDCLDQQMVQQLTDVNLNGRIYDVYWVPLDADTFLHYAVDVTDIRETTEVLDKTEKHYRLITEAILQGILQVNAAGVIVFANPAAMHLSGYFGKELYGMSVQMLFASALPEFKKSREGYLSDNPIVGEDTLVCKDGRCVPVFISRAPLVDDAGRYTGFICSILDISQRKKNEEELTRLSAAVRQMGEAVLITESSGRIVYVNPAFEEVTGFSSDEALGKTPRILNSGRHDRAFFADLWNTILAGNRWSGRIINRKKDGTLFTQEAVISPVRDTAGEHSQYIAVLRDITEELKKDEQYRQLQKMEALGRLAGGVAHDFNNVLQGILGLCDLMLMGIKTGDDQQQCIRDIRMETQRATQLTRQLLAFSRKEEQEFQLVDLNQLAINQQKMLERLLGIQISFNLNLASNLYQVRAAPSQIEQVLMNLCINARDAMPNGGKLTISTSNCTLVGNRFSSHQDHVRLRVADNGTGMDAEVRDRLFEPFFTTKPDGKGTGLGLALAFGIIKQHQGWIEVSSEPGQGSAFDIYLPACTESVSGESERGRMDSEAGEWAGHGEHILLVEDEEMIRGLAINILESSGYTVTAAENPGQAIQFFEREQDRIDLLISDVVLPDKNGFRLALDLVQRNPDLPVILCSGFYDGIVDMDAIKAAGFSFLQKPFSLQDLLREVSWRLKKEDCQGSCL